VTIVFGTGGTVTATDSITVTVDLHGDTVNEAVETLTLTGADAARWVSASAPAA